MSPSLLTATDARGHVHLVVGASPLAGARVKKSLEVGARPVLIASNSAVSYGLEKSVEDGQVQWLKRDLEELDLTTLGREEVDHVVDAVFVTSGAGTQATHISTLCKRLRIPVNVVDKPDLCSFTLLSTHTSGPVQIGVTTSGSGCKLALRIRREIAASLPPDLGPAVERLATLRRRIRDEDHALGLDAVADDDNDGVDTQTPDFNRFVNPMDIEAARTRRMRWLTQICEYWPLSRLASISDEDVSTLLQSYINETQSTISTTAQPPTPPAVTTSSTLSGPSMSLAHHSRPGRIILAGSGPGHPDLLTTLTLKAIKSADLILADKLVPAGVLDLIPRRTPVHIARKFPGNAEAAQEELLSLGLAAAQQGKTVLRLKQGDPYLYGRGAEEYDFFRSHGYGGRISVLPGVTSALSAPLFARVPVTHRGVSDQVLICTGTGRRGAAPDPPLYKESQTVVFLMALHRLNDLMDALKEKGWPVTTPCAVIERASCPDQRVIRSSLEYVGAAVEEEGSRPPGLLVVGHACEVLMKVDEGSRWIVEEGLTGLDLGLDGVGIGGAFNDALVGGDTQVVGTT